MLAVCLESDIILDIIQLKTHTLVSKQMIIVCLGHQHLVLVITFHINIMFIYPMTIIEYFEIKQRIKTERKQRKSALLRAVLTVYYLWLPVQGLTQILLFKVINHTGEEYSAHIT